MSVESRRVEHVGLGSERGELPAILLPEEAASELRGGVAERRDSLRTSGASR